MGWFKIPADRPRHCWISSQDGKEPSKKERALGLPQGKTCASDPQMEEYRSHMVNDSSRMEKQSLLYFMELLHVEGTSVAIYADMYVEIGRPGSLKGWAKSKPNHRAFLTLRLAPGMENGFLIPWNAARQSRVTWRGPHHRTAELDEATKSPALCKASRENRTKTGSMRCGRARGTVERLCHYRVPCRGDCFGPNRAYLFWHRHTTQNRTKPAPFRTISNLL